jgi:hypothetical protein
MIRTILILCTMLAGACGGSSEDLAADARRFKDAACACNGDPGCLDRAARLEQDFQRKMHARYRSEADIPKSLKDQLAPIYTAWDTCMMARK